MTAKFPGTLIKQSPKFKVSPNFFITLAIFFCLYDAAISPSAASKVSIRVGDLRVSDLLILISLTYILINWKNERKTIHPDAQRIFKIILFASCVSICLGFLLNATFYDIYSNTRGLIALGVGTTFRFERRNLILLTVFSCLAVIILIIFRLPIGVDFATLITVIAGINFTFSNGSNKFTKILKYLISAEAFIISFMVDQRVQIFLLLPALILVMFFPSKFSNHLKESSHNNILKRSLAFGLLLMLTCTILLFYPPLRIYLQTLLVEQLINSNSEIGNQLSFESRKSQLSIGIDALKSSWIYGHGPGFSYLFQEPGKRMENTYITHNFLMDTSLRIGLPITILLLTTVVLSIFKVFARDLTDLNIKFGALIFLISLFSKGLFESILDKPRTYVIFGICLGLTLNNIKESEKLSYKRSDSLL